MGSLVKNDDKKKKQIQTSYYMSPEILLRLPYDQSADIWALGCTIYELLTSTILFDPDEYNGNEDRFQLHMISKLLGNIPQSMIAESRYKDVFFTFDMNNIKEFNHNSNFNPILQKQQIKTIIFEKYDKVGLEGFELDKQKLNELCDFMFDCLVIVKENRITVTRAYETNIICMK